MSHMMQDMQELDRIQRAAFAPTSEEREAQRARCAAMADSVELIGTRWSIEQCESFIQQHGVQGLRTFGVPVDYTGMRKLSDMVPYSAKKLEALTRKFCSASPEYAPRTKSNARYEDQNLRQRLPKSFAGGALFTRQSPPQPWESGPNTLPGMEEHARRSQRGDTE